MKSSPLVPIVLVLLLALPAASWWFIFKPMDKNLADLEIANRAKAEKIASLDRATAEVKDLPAEIEKLRKAIRFFEDKLPEEKEMDKVLREVWQLAEKNGLHTKSVRSLKAIPSSDYSEQPIRMVITGPFGGFYDFLKAVEGLPRITRIGEMLIDKDMKNEGQMTADFVLSIYFDRSEQRMNVAGLQ